MPIITSTPIKAHIENDVVLLLRKKECLNRNVLEARCDPSFCVLLVSMWSFREWRGIPDVT